MFFDGKLQGIEIFIMQSAINKQKVLNRAINNEYNFPQYDRQFLLNEALNYFKLSKNDFTINDYNELLSWIQ